MSGVNKVILIGRLGADPEVKLLQSGYTVANLRLAVSESYRNKQGEKVESTEWFDLELWEGLAKLAKQYLSKGDQIYAEGKLKTESWKADDGSTRSRTRIRCSSMTFLQKSSTKPPSTPPPAADQPPETDNLPF